MKLNLPASLNNMNSHSFTILEAIIAIFILSVGILAVLAMFPFGVKMANSSEMAVIATQLCQEKMEEIISRDYDEISSEAKQVMVSPFSAFSRETEVVCFDANGDFSLPNCPDTGMKKIKVIVSWGPSYPSAKIEIFTLISRK